MNYKIKTLFLISIIALTIISCKEDDGGCGANPFQVTPSSPYEDPVWHPSGKIIGFNHKPIKEINYNGYECPTFATYTFENDSAGFWLINSDGTNQRRVLPYYLQTPVWSPDGNWIAFVQGAQIFKMLFDGEKFDTTDIVQLTFEGRNFFPSWSSNGEWITYDSDVESETGLKFIWKMKSDGSEGNRIAYTPTLGETRMPFWGANNSIVQIRYIGIGSPEIFLMDTVGNNVNRITENENRESYPKFSKTGNEIAYISQSSVTGGLGLWMIDLNDPLNEQLIESKVENFSWSPDGKNIVYLNYDSFYPIDELTGVLWIINIEDKTKKQLTYNTFNVIK